MKKKQYIVCIQINYRRSINHTGGPRLVRFNMRKLSLLDDDDDDEFNVDDDDDDDDEAEEDETANRPFFRAIRQLSRVSK